MIDGHATYWALAAAVETGTLEVAARGASADEVAAACAVDRDRVVPILEVLVAAGLLARTSDRYGTTPTTDGYLRAGSPSDLRPLVLTAPGRHANWLGLAAVVGGAPPADPVDGDDEGFATSLARSTFMVQHQLAARVAARLRSVLPDAPVVLDVASGAAPWAIAFLEANPSASAVCADVAPLLDVAAELLDAHSCRHRAELVAVDRRSAVPDATADVVVLPNICRNQGADEAETLIAHAANAVAPGGRLVVADYFVDSRVPARARRAAALGVTMVANTERGATFPASRYEEWLQAAGVFDVEVIDGRPAPHDVIVATRSEQP